MASILIIGSDKGNLLLIGVYSTFPDDNGRSINCPPSFFLSETLLGDAVYKTN